MKVFILIQFAFLFCSKLSQAAWDGPFEIRSASGTGKCIDVHGPDYFGKVNGGYVQVWDCNGVEHQKWFYNDETKQLRVGNLGGKCLDVHGPDHWDKVNGGKVQTWDCNGVAHQKWYIDGDKLKGGSGKCVDIHGPDERNNGGKIQMWDCTGISHQRWRLARVDYEVHSVSFDYDQVEYVNERPLVVGRRTLCDNEDGGETDKKVTLIVDQDVTHSNSFEHSSGFELSIGATFKTGVPLVAGGEIETTLTASQSFTWGKEVSINKHYGAQFEVTCAPGEIIEGVASVWTTEMIVPYTMKYKSKCCDIYFSSNGIWHGESSWELTCDFTKLN